MKEEKQPPERGTNSHGLTKLAEKPASGQTTTLVEDKPESPEIETQQKAAPGKITRPKSLRTSKRKRRGRWILPLALVLLIGAGAGTYFWWNSSQPGAKSLPQTSTATSNSVVGLTVAATGQVQARADLSLTFGASGTVTEVLAAQGDNVKKGQVIAKIDDSDLQSAVKTAKANLTSAQASLDKLKAGATETEIQTAQEQLKQAQIKAETTKTGTATAADIQSAQSQLNSALAKLEQDKQGGSATEKATAEASVNSAQANLNSAQIKLDSLLAGPDQATVTSAKAAYEQAQANFEKTKSNLYSQLVSAQVSRDQALTALNNAQDNYSNQYNINHNPDGSLKSGVKDADITKETQLYRALQDAQGNYNRADTSLNDAKVGYDTGLRNAQITLDNAKVQLDDALAGPTASDIATARASVESAKAQLESAQANLANLAPTALTLASDQASVDSARANLAKLSGGTESDIAAAESNVKIQELTLQNLLAGPTPSELAVSEAQLETAQANYDKAVASLENANVTAPYDGVISSLSVIPGQVVSASTAVAQLVDASVLHVDVNVGESDIGKIKLNQGVTLSFDAITGQSFTGKVTFISPKATVTSNVVSYLVTVTLDGTGKNSLQEAFPDQYQKFLDALSQGRPGGAQSGRTTTAAAGTQGTSAAQTTQSGTRPAGTVQPSTTRNSQSSTTTIQARATSFCGYTPRFGGTSQAQPKVGMTATVTVCLNAKAGVLSVPTRAIKSEIVNGAPVQYVQVLVDSNGTLEKRTVTTGLAGDSTTEITGGELQAGEKVVVNSTPTSTSSSSGTNNNLFGGGGGPGGPP